MWRNLVVLAAAILVGALATYSLDHAQDAPSGATKVTGAVQPSAAQPVPQFTFKTLDGREKSIRDFKGRKVILNFWASWCAPCVKEFPFFLKLAQEHPDDIVFIGLSSDHDATAMNRFLSKMTYSHPAAMAADNVFIALDEDGAITRDVFQTYRLPETILIDETGTMREKMVGADWTYEDLVEKVSAF